MNVSYHHANPRSGNESFLLRFESESHQTQNACVLIDSGVNVKVEELLRDDEYLTAILLTHAHADHYLSLPSNVRDGAPIYTSKATARILDSVLNDAQQHAGDGFGETETVLDALDPIDDWASPTKGLWIAPIPAGHSPGAAGFLIQFENGGGERETILATGDWTRQRVAGYSGFDPYLPVSVDAVFLTGATSDSYEQRLTNSVETICERAYAGSSVLISATGLMGVQYSYLLGHLAETLNRRLPITAAGQVGTLYEDLDYEVPNVEAVPEFDDPSELLASGSIAIAGPESVS